MRVSGRRIGAKKRRIAALATLALGIGLVAAPAALADPTPVYVQGTTDVSDSGLLEDVIVPGFQAAYPQYELKYIAVGTGAAITAAKAGQGDALVVHAPSQEKPFVEEGYSLEPRGRAIFYSDYVIPGPLDDPAGVLAGAPHNAALAYELIAKAGAEGKANFVSRGDKSGTNTQELAIWKLTDVELNKLGEPGKAGTEAPADLAPWYHKGGGGQAQTVLLAQQCPFAGGGCYEMTDRGTFNRLVNNGSVTALQIVSQQNEAAAPGGSNLLTNPFSAYVVNPAKVGVSTNVGGAEAFVAYLTSEGFQERLASYPTATSPAFFADAHPTLTASPVNATYDSGTAFTISGNVTNLLPGSPPVAGVPVNLQEASPGLTDYATIASAITEADGSYLVPAVATRSGPLRIEVPNTSDTYPNLLISPLIAAGALSQTFAGAGQITIAAPSSSTSPPTKVTVAPTVLRGSVVLRRPSLNGKVVTLQGQLVPPVLPATAPAILVLGRKVGTTQKFHSLKKVRPKPGVAYKVSVKLSPGKWKLRVRYQDPAVFSAGVSRIVSVSVR